MPTWVAQISTALLDEGGAGISDIVPPPLDELVDELAPELELELDAPLLEEDDELPELDEELVDPPEDVELLEEPELLELPDEDDPELLAGALPLPDPPPHPARTAARSKAPASDALEGLPHAGRTGGTLFQVLSAILESSRNTNVRRERLL